MEQLNSLLTTKNGTRVLNEFKSKEVLASLGLPITKQVLAKSEAEAIQAAEEIGFPVVMKLIADDVVHKSDLNAVILNVASISEVREKFAELMKISTESVKSISIQEQAPQPIAEIIVGTLKDPQFGPAVMFGIGGVLVELMEDVSFRIAPLTPFDANEMIHEIKAFKLLDGFRGREKADLNALQELILKVSALVDARPEIREMDLNPVFVYKDGLKIVDARIILD